MNDHITHRSIKNLRHVLRANAAFSMVSGVTALLGGSWISRELGIDHSMLTRLIGAGLIGFAAAVAAISRLDERRLTAEALLVSIADATWVLGTIAVVLAGWLNTTGALAMSLIALVVADLGATQLWFRAKALGDDRERRPATV